jgi:hypothetical protein
MLIKDYFVGIKLGSMQILRYIIFNTTSTSYMNVWHYPKIADTTKLLDLVSTLSNANPSANLIAWNGEVYLTAAKYPPLGSRLNLTQLWQ